MTAPDPKSRSLVSIIVPALNEEPSIPHLLERMSKFKAENSSYDFELILVDDGSTDQTAAAAAVNDRDFAVTVVRLARNFGSHQALSAGLHHCNGDAAIAIGADAQEPDEVITRFLETWKSGTDVVWGVRRTRKGRSRREEFMSIAFSWMFTRLAKLENYPPEGPSGMLVDRRVIDEVNKLEERNRNVMALIAWLGFRQSTLEYDQVPRLHGETRWTRTKMIKLAVDSMLQFSSLPLRACTFVGLTFAALGLVYAAVLVTRTLFGVETPEGWTTLLVVVVLMGGVQLAVIGIVGEYLWRTIEEVRARPLFVVRDIFRSGSVDHQPAPRLEH